MTLKNKSDCDLLEIFAREKLVKICAPMVRYSKLQFRTLVREYGCDICFTPMILADSFCVSQKARENEFTTNKLDTPVVVQFAANTIQNFVGAANLVAPYCNGVDLNCGCPQRWAKQLGLGCTMLENPQLIADMVRQCRNQIAKPFSVSVKMRLTKDIKKTVEICKQLEHCGATFLTVHARTPNQNSGAINESALKLIKENVNCPVVANGGVKTLQDAVDIQDKTNCDGVMAANGLLTNPTLFSGTYVTTFECVQKWVDICYNSNLNADNFHSRSLQTDTSIERGASSLTYQCFHHHLVFMLEKLLPKHSRRIFNNLQTFEDVLEFLRVNFNIVPNLYDLDRFTSNDSLKLNYDNRNDVYLNLQLKDYTLDSKVAKCSDYLNDCNNPGKFFTAKATDLTVNECDISNLFLTD